MMTQLPEGPTLRREGSVTPLAAPDFAHWDTPAESTRLVSFSIPLTGVTGRQFLATGEGQARFCWHTPHEFFAGIGTAAQISAWGPNRFEKIQQDAAELFREATISHSQAVPRLFGGFAFSPNFIPDNTWTVFSPAEFVLPHYQFTQIDADAWLTLNVIVAQDEPCDEAELLAALHERAHQLGQIALPVASPLTLKDIRYPMPFEKWAARINEAVEQFRAGAMQKVVLARVCELAFEQSVSLDHALAYLDQHYAESHRFLFEATPHHAFYGATPELLVRVQGDQLRTMGLAGSIKRGKTPDEDAALGSQILRDPKERFEHEVVVNEIRQRLLPVTTQLDIPDGPEVLKLSNIQHLHTPIHGRLKSKSGVLPLVELLHPTPALGGSPRDKALAFIDHAEPVPRGWYAGPVGWLDPNLDGAFAVAIRSAVTQDRRIWCYAGAGIVGDSVPQKEWDETALKFRPMLNALGVSNEVRP